MSPYSRTLVRRLSWMTIGFLAGAIVTFYAATHYLMSSEDMLRWTRRSDTIEERLYRAFSEPKHDFSLLTQLSNLAEALGEFRNDFVPYRYMHLFDKFTGNLRETSGRRMLGKFTGSKDAVAIHTSSQCNVEPKILRGVSVPENSTVVVLNNRITISVRSVFISLCSFNINTDKGDYSHIPAGSVGEVANSLNTSLGKFRIMLSEVRDSEKSCAFNIYADDS